MRKTDLVVSPYLKGHAYRYVRTTDNLPSTDAARAQDDPYLRVKLFSPSGGWTWYLAGYDRETHIAWGLVNGHEQEIGDFSMEELVALKVPVYFGKTKAGELPIERDLHWTPKRLSEVRGKVA